MLLAISTTLTLVKGRMFEPRLLPVAMLAAAEIRLALFQVVRHTLAEVLRIAADLLLAIGDGGGFRQGLKQPLVDLAFDDAHRSRRRQVGDFAGAFRHGLGEAV